MVIDAHHHFWNYDPVAYDWIDDKMNEIRSDFLPGKLEQIILASGINGVVTVQARQSVEESIWLLELAHRHEFIKGVVGWLPLMDSGLEAYLEHFADEKLLKGVRHIIQAEPDPEFVLKRDFNRGISLLKNFQLVYDILIVENQLPNIIRMVDQHPDQVFVLDHIAKPQIRKNELSPWREQIQQLAKRLNVNCKISGMVTEAEYHHWSTDQLDPYFEVVLEAFGANRLLFGSDWPVCLVATTYSDWMNLVRNKISGLSQNEQNKIMGGNAKRIYKLKVEN